MNDYYIGLDVGSDSVGWAVTDENYNLKRLKGKTAWGARLFSGATDAKKRRMFRTSKRRMARRRYRIHLINEIFANHLREVDEYFLIRLAESQLLLSDKKNKMPFYLLGSKEQDRAYYKKYPTIWHLRSALVHGEEDAYKDLRLVYLAIHHIIKYRGNFLIDGKFERKFDTDRLKDLNRIFENIIIDGDETYDESFELFTSDSYLEVLNILQDEKLNTSDRKKQLKKIANSKEEISNYVDLFITLVSGGSFASTKIFKEDEKIDIKFDSSYDENEDKIKTLFGPYFEIIEIAKALYDYVYLNKLIGTYDYLSDAFKNVYDVHRKELHLLKGFLIDIDRFHGLKSTDKESLFYKVFRDKDSKDNNNYVSYIRASNLEKSRASIHDFNKFLYTYLNEEKDLFLENTEYKQLLELANKGELLQIIANVSNSTIPHQLHEQELNAILDNAEKYFPFLKAEKEKILTIFRFKVPYFYGPLDNRSKYSNVVRKNNEKIYPWNIDNIIDKDKTRSRFMENLTNECTILNGETVLPAASILYMDYIIFDRLNRIIINGDLITQEIKLDLFNNLISKRAKTTVNNIKKYLKDKYDIYRTDDVSISGLNPNDSFNATSRFILSKCYDIDGKDFDIVEDIIFALTIYTDNKKDALEYIKKNYNLTDEQEKTIMSLNCKGWGTFSRKFLNLRSVDNNGEIHNSIIELLHDTTLNLNKILFSNKYNFEELINQHNREFMGLRTNKDIANELIEKIPPLMRRSTIQTMRIVEEITKISKCAPKKILIEVTRENDIRKKGKQTDSRKLELRKFLESFLAEKNENAENLLKELESISLDKLRAKSLYLYFKQLGLDIYTGEKIKIEDVFDSTKYDIDHIVPQSLIKDDSIDNTVLTSKHINEVVKKDLYPLPENIRCTKKVMALWTMLHKKKAISDKKFNALVRKTEITEAELADFINRQINVVNQSNKILKDVFEVLYPNTKIIFSKAQYPAHIRQELDIPKVRDLNDTHHAIDAYLNIVAGDILITKFGNMRLIKAKEKNDKISFNLDRELERKLLIKDKDNKVIDYTNLGKLVYNTCFRHDFLLTYRNTYQDDAFYKQTIFKKNSTGLIPLHTKNPQMDTEKYGGYKSLSTKYLVIATKTNHKNNTISKVLVRVPALYVALYKNEEELKNKLLEQLELKKYETAEINLKIKICNDQKVFVCGSNYLLCSKISLKPFSPIFLSVDSYKYLKKIEKYRDVCKNSTEDVIKIQTDKNATKFVEISKKGNLKIVEELINIATMKKYDYCTIICRLRTYDIEEFKVKTIYNQIGEILEMIKVFGRNQSTANLEIVKSTFRKAMNCFLEDEVYLIDDSITGLYSRKIRL